MSTCTAAASSEPRRRPGICARRCSVSVTRALRLACGSRSSSSPPLPVPGPLIEGDSRMPSKSSASVPLAQSSRSVVPKSSAASSPRAAGSSPPSAPLEASASASRSRSVVAVRSGTVGGASVMPASQVATSSSGSRTGFCSSICATSWCSSSVDICSSLIDCCSCGVSARCCESLNCREARMPRHILKCSPRYTRRTWGSSTMSCGRPSASTVPSLMM